MNRDERNRADDHDRPSQQPARDAGLDKTIEASFPASDPPSTVPDPDDRDALDQTDTPSR